MVSDYAKYWQTNISGKKSEEKNLNFQKKYSFEFLDQFWHGSIPFSYTKKRYKNVFIS